MDGAPLLPLIPSVRANGNSACGRRVGTATAAGVLTSSGPAQWEHNSTSTGAVLPFLRPLYYDRRGRPRFCSLLVPDNAFLFVAQDTVFVLHL